MALLFRQEGVPARVVSGFKIPRITLSVMTLRSRDAHAWVEIWDERRGEWLVMDPTPPLPFTDGGVLEAVSETLWALEDRFSLFWYRSVVKGEEEVLGGGGQARVSSQTPGMPFAVEKITAALFTAVVVVVLLLLS